MVHLDIASLRRRKEEMQDIRLRGRVLGDEYHFISGLHRGLQSPEAIRELVMKQPILAAEMLIHFEDDALHEAFVNEYRGHQRPFYREIVSALESLHEYRVTNRESTEEASGMSAVPVRERPDIEEHQNHFHDRESNLY